MIYISYFYILVLFGKTLYFNKLIQNMFFRAWDMFAINAHIQSDSPSVLVSHLPLLPF